MTVQINGSTGVTTPAVSFVGAATNTLLPSLTAGTYTQNLPTGNGVLLLSSVTMNFPTTLGASGNVLTTDGAGNLSWTAGGGGSGSVTSVGLSFTGGVVSVTPSSTPVTTSGTLALTVAGTSGGIPYFSSASSWASSGVLAANSLVIGGGSGAAPSTITTGAGVVAALGNATNSAGGFPVLDGSGVTPIAQGGTGLSALGIAGQVLTVNGGATAAVWASPAGTGTVTSVGLSFTGGVVSVTPASTPVTSSGTLALTVSGTSGGVPYFDTATSWATSSVLAANSLMIGGGAGAAPSTITTGTGVVTALGNATGAAGGLVVAGATPLTQHGVVVGGASGALNSTAVGTTGQLFIGQRGAAPIWSATPTLGVAGTTAGTLALSGSASGTVTLRTPAAAGTNTLTLPATTSTLIALTDFTNNQSLSSSGYLKLPGGMILQYGSGSTDGAGQGSVTFPIAFTTNSVISIIPYSNLTIASVAKTLSSTGFTNAIFNTNTGNGISSTFGWIAIGW